jgi:dTDP-4-amino-4,6-dideoxygalactose transaminase
VKVEPRIFLSPPHVFGDEQQFVDSAFKSNWIAPLGPNVDAFEAECAAAVRVSHAVALSSGTAAIHLAVRILGAGIGDEVICSSLTFNASANPIVYERATPVFVDSDETWNIDPNLLEDALKSRGSRVKAVVAVDLYGQSADYDAIEELCDRFGVPLIEDAAEALGASYKGKPTGGFGQMGILSFNGNKIITTSGGGMLLSNDKKFIEQARFLATQARDPAPHYQHSQIGFNYRMSNILAGVGRGQLLSLDQRVAARRAVFNRYVAALGTLPGICFMPEAPYGECTRWLTSLTVDPARFEANREDIRLALEEQNIEARPVWKPLHLQPVFAGVPVFGGRVSQGLFENGLCLPSGSSLNERDQSRVIETVMRVAKSGSSAER